MKNRWVHAIGVVIWGAWLCASAAFAVTTPTRWVKSMLNEVMAVQSDPALQGHAHRDQRKAAIKKIIAKSFDFDAMARTALGPQWKILNQNQAREFQSLFERLFQDSYTRLVLDFLKKEKVDYRKETLQGQRATVTTSIVRVNDTIPVKYFLHRKAKKWLIDDVEVDGVSIVHNYRRAFARVIKRRSYEALVQRMRIQLKTID